MKKDPRFKHQEYSKEQVKGHFDGACKKLKAAEKIINEDPESAYELIYEVMLKASLALLLKHELRPRSLPGHHVATIEMSSKILGKEFDAYMKLFDEMRRNRNNFLYEAFGFISSHEVADAISATKKYLKIIKTKIEL